MHALDQALRQTKLGAQSALAPGHLTGIGLMVVAR
jgi:hypothetical protein